MKRIQSPLIERVIVSELEDWAFVEDVSYELEEYGRDYAEFIVKVIFYNGCLRDFPARVYDDKIEIMYCEDGPWEVMERDDDSIKLLYIAILELPTN